MAHIPLISIIMPVYNAQNCLADTLAALVGQSLESIEIICVDDGSTDNSGAIIDEFAARDHRIVPIHTPNQGAYKARETGIDAARGRYIGFCDADDTPHPGMYESLGNRVLSDSSEMGVCAFQRISSSGTILSTEMQGLSPSAIDVTSKDGWLVTINTSLWNKIIRRDVLEKRIRLANPPRVMEDAMLLISLYPYLSRISFVDEPFYSYSAPEQSAMSSVDPSEIPLLVESWKLLRRHVSQAEQDYLPIVDLAAFIHLRISAPIRMDREKRKDATVVIGAALDESFPLWKSSPFMSMSYVHQHRRLLTTFIAHVCCRLHVLDVALDAYNALTKATGKEIKW